jgi:hypothetical protein
MRAVAEWFLGPVSEASSMAVPRTACSNGSPFRVIGSVSGLLKSNPNITWHKNNR